MEWVQIIVVLTAIILSAYSAIQSEILKTTNDFQDINQVFRSTYSDAKNEVLLKYIHSYPLITVHGEVSELWFYNQSKYLLNDTQCKLKTCTRFTYLTTRFTEIKSVVHTPIAIFNIIKADYIRNKHGAFDQTTINHLLTLQKKVNDGLIPSIKKSFNITSQDGKDAMLLATETLSFASAALKTRSIPPMDLNKFLQGLVPTMMRLTTSAAKLAMNNVVDSVRSWRMQANITEHAWNNTRVFVHGADTSREDGMEKLIFNWLLGEKREGNRVVYDECGMSDVDMLGKAAHDFLDVEMSRSVFNVDWRMHRDVMGDAAREFVGLDPVKAMKSLCPHAHKLKINI